MAFLNQRVGRWSLRGSRSKAQQVTQALQSVEGESAFFPTTFLARPSEWNNTPFVSHS